MQPKAKTPQNGLYTHRKVIKLWKRQIVYVLQIRSHDAVLTFSSLDAFCAVDRLSRRLFRTLCNVKPHPHDLRS